MSKGTNIASFKSGEPRWFKSTPNYVQPDLKTDRETGIIRDVSVCTAGEAKGHGVMLEQSFIDDVVRLGNEWKQGLKCRFGHPNMSNESLGTYMGRFQNFRVSGNKAIADLHLDEVSKNSPGGDLYTYVIEMADRNPDMFGTSICFLYKSTYHYDDKGQKVIGTNPGDGPTYITIDKLLATDVVDEPAANAGGLFSSSFNSTQFAVRTTEFLDENPDVWEFVEAHPEKFKPFLEKYNAYKQKLSHKMPKKTVKPKGFFAKLADAIVSHQTTETFATTDQTTAEGNNIRIVAAGEEPAVGDEVYIIDSDGAESVAPNGDHTITGGDYDGWVLTVVDGLITAIVKPDASNSQTNPPVDNSAQQSAGKTAAQLQAENDALTKQLNASQAELKIFKDKALDDHTAVVPQEDSTGKPAGTKDEKFYNQPWNRKHKKTA